MVNQQSIVEQIVQNLAFEVEAVPKNKTVQDTSLSESTPLNVKIRVRKKDETHMQHDTASNDESQVQKVRLVSSDQTIMSFDVFMEAGFEGKSSRKPRKHIFGALRSGICLGATDDDEYPYMPSSSYSANITEPYVTTGSDGVVKRNFTLSKNIYNDYSVATHTGNQKWPFGKCKPGGCLDPPFSEDKYPYKPSARVGNEENAPETTVIDQQKLHSEVLKSDVKISEKPSRINDEDVKNEVKSNGRHSSIFDGGLFRKKRKSSDKSTNTNLQDTKADEANPILNLYQVESTVSSLGKHSDRIITYPPQLTGDLKISDNKTMKSRGPSEDKSRNSFNDHSEAYFIPPKGVDRIKEKDMLTQRDYPRRRSSDVSETKRTPKESLKVPISILIPVPIPLAAGLLEPKTVAADTNGDNFETQIDNSSISDQNSIPENKLIDQMKDTEIPVEQTKTGSVIREKNTNPLESLKQPNSAPLNSELFIQKPATLSKVDDGNSIELNLPSDKDIENESNLKDTGEHLGEKSETKPFKMPTPTPIPIPVSIFVNDPDYASNTELNAVYDDINKSDKKLTQSLEMKTVPIDNQEKDLEDINQDVNLLTESDILENKKIPTTQVKEDPKGINRMNLAVDPLTVSDLTENNKIQDNQEKSFKGTNQGIVPLTGSDLTENNKIPTNRKIKDTKGMNQNEVPLTESDLTKSNHTENNKKPANQENEDSISINQVVVPLTGRELLENNKIPVDRVDDSKGKIQDVIPLKESGVTQKNKIQDNQEIYPKGINRDIVPLTGSDIIENNRTPTNQDIKDTIGINQDVDHLTGSGLTENDRTEKDKKRINQEKQDIKGINQDIVSIIKSKPTEINKIPTNQEKEYNKSLQKDVVPLTKSDPTENNKIPPSQDDEGSKGKNQDVVPFKESGLTETNKIQDNQEKYSKGKDQDVVPLTGSDLIKSDRTENNKKPTNQENEDYLSINQVVVPLTGRELIENNKIPIDRVDDSQGKIQDVVPFKESGLAENNKVQDNQEKSFKGTNQGIVPLTGSDLTENNKIPTNRKIKYTKRMNQNEVPLTVSDLTKNNRTENNKKPSNQENGHSISINQVVVPLTGRELIENNKIPTDRVDDPKGKIQDVVPFKESGLPENHKIQDNQEKYSKGKDQDIVPLTGSDLTENSKISTNQKIKDTKSINQDVVPLTGSDLTKSDLTGNTKIPTNQEKEDTKGINQNVVPLTKSDITKNNEIPNDQEDDSKGENQDVVSLTGSDLTDNKKIEDNQEKEFQDKNQDVLPLTGSESNLKKNGEQPVKKSETQPFKVPIPIPIPINDSNHAATPDPNAVHDDKKENNKKSKQSIEMNTIPINNQGKDPEVTQKDLISLTAIVRDVKRKSKDEIKYKLGKPTKESDKKYKGDETIKLPGKTAVNYLEEISDRYIGSYSDIDEIKLKPDVIKNENFEKTSQFLASILQKDSSSQTSTSSAGDDDTYRNDSKPIQNVYEVVHIDAALSGNNDDIKNILHNGPDEETDVSPSYSHKDKKSEFTKREQIVNPKKIYNVYPFTDTKFPKSASINFKTAPIIIYKIEENEEFMKLKEVHSVTGSISEPIGKHTSSFELQLNESFASADDEIKLIKYDSDHHHHYQRSSPSEKSERVVSPDKHIILSAKDTREDSSKLISKLPGPVGHGAVAEGKDLSDEIKNKLLDKSNMRRVSIISLIPSTTSTLKSALKKDAISVELGFYSYLNDKNERILKSFDVSNEPTRFLNDSVTIIKSQIKISSNEIRISVDSDHDMSIQIKKPVTNQRVSICDSGFVSALDNGKVIKQKTNLQPTGGEVKSPEARGYDKIIESDIMDENFINLYEQELVPLQMIIKNLRDEIDVLATQQMLYRDKIFCPRKPKTPRLVHSNKKCVGCLRKF